MYLTELRIMEGKEVPLELLGLKMKKAYYLFPVNIL